VTGPAIIVKADESEFADWLATEAGFLTAFARYGDSDVAWEPYQVAFLNSQARFRSVKKSRQVGGSFTMAAESLARAHLKDGYLANFVSYNRDDAKEKIQYAREFHDALPLRFQKPLKRESLTELVFRSNSPGRRESKILSHPSKAPRGKKGDIYLDELAHYAHDRKVYRGSTALISRVPGAQFTICSTPLGARGQFWEVADNHRGRFRKFWRQEIPWWLCSAFCTNVRVAAVIAPGLETPERVERFGTEALREQYEALPLEDFREEFECIFLDESSTYYPLSLLLACQDPELEIAHDVDELGKGGHIRIGKGRIVVGVDIGRKRDATEIAAFEVNVRDCHVMRLLQTLENVPFAEQEGVLRRLLERVPVAACYIDQSGIGMNLAENLARDYPQVVPCSFSNEAKERWCVSMKIRLQRGQKAIVLPASRSLLSQFRSIKRKVLPSGKVQFSGRGDGSDDPGGRRHHADQFWACALATQREVDESLSRGMDYEVICIG